MSSNDDVVHNWANQTGRARKSSNGNLWYEGRTIYSYGLHFPIATITDDTTVFLTTERYSITTSAHVSRVARAIPPQYRIIRVPNPERATWPHDVHRRDVMHALIKRVATAAAEARRARSEYKRDHKTAAANAERENLVAWCAWAGMPDSFPTLADVDATLAVLTAEADARLAAYQAEKAKRDREAALENRERLRQWLAGADVRPPHTPRPYVRVKGEQVETSWGVKVPLSEALALYRRADACRRSGCDEAPTGVETIGGYALRRIDRTGGLQVGCHAIPYRFAQLAACLAGISIGAPRTA